MEKKVSPDAPGAEHLGEGELRQEIFEEEARQEAGGRRQSVAHNIIENPLKVGLEYSPRAVTSRFIC